MKFRAGAPAYISRRGESDGRETGRQARRVGVRDALSRSAWLGSLRRPSLPREEKAPVPRFTRAHGAGGGF